MTTDFADEYELEEDAPVREKDRMGIFFTRGPVGMLNTDRLSAPSPIQFSLEAGINIPFLFWFSFAPSVNMFTTYYLWRGDASGGRAYPAEIENRTALAPALLIDAPAIFYLKLGNSTISAGAGLSFLARYAFLSGGVPETKAEDVKKINDFFYSGMRFIYPSVQLVYDYTTTSGMRAGIMLKGWLPLGSLAGGRGLDGGMASIAVRIMIK